MILLKEMVYFFCSDLIRQKKDLLLFSKNMIKMHHLFWNASTILTLNFALDKLNLFSISQKDLYFQCISWDHLNFHSNHEFRLELLPSDPLSVTLNQVWAEFSYFSLVIQFQTLIHSTLLTAEIIKWQKCAHMGLNGFHIKCIIGTHCN